MRLFVAFETTEEIHARCAELQAQLKTSDRKVTWTAPHNLHVTLKFLGESDDAAVEQVERELAAAARAAEPFEISFKGVGAFPGGARPRVLVVEAEETPASLVNLHSDMESRMASLGFERENRRFRPHLTLGRVRETRRGPAKPWTAIVSLRDAPVGRQQVSEVALFKSTLAPSGPIYAILARLPLGGGVTGAERS